MEGPAESGGILHRESDVTEGVIKLQGMNATRRAGSYGVRENVSTVTGEEKTVGLPWGQENHPAWMFPEP